MAVSQYTTASGGTTIEGVNIDAGVVDLDGVAAALVVGPIGATAGINTGISLNATGDTKAVHLNIADTWAGADTVTASGTITLTWTIMS